MQDAIAYQGFLVVATFGKTAPFSGCIIVDCGSGLLHLHTNNSVLRSRFIIRSSYKHVNRETENRSLYFVFDQAPISQNGHCTSWHWWSASLNHTLRRKSYQPLPTWRHTRDAPPRRQARTTCCAMSVNGILTRKFASIHLTALLASTSC